MSLTETSKGSVPAALPAPGDPCLRCPKRMTPTHKGLDDGDANRGPPGRWGAACRRQLSRVVLCGRVPGGERQGRSRRPCASAEPGTFMAAPRGHGEASGRWPQGGSLQPPSLCSDTRPSQTGCGSSLRPCGSVQGHHNPQPRCSPAPARAVLRGTVRQRGR